MPVYTYQCTNCNSVTEKRQSFNDAPLTTCEQCSGSLRRVIHPVGIVFKGSGWYVTDSRSTTSGGTSASSSSTESKAGSDTSESKPAESTSSDSKGKSETPASSSTSTPSSSSAPSKDV